MYLKRDNYLELGLIYLYPCPTKYFSNKWIKKSYHRTNLEFFKCEFWYLLWITATVYTISVFRKYCLKK